MAGLTEVKVKVIPDCDYCKEYDLQTQAVYDAKSKYGYWAYMCEEHFKMFGTGLGTGKGQKLIKV